MACPEDGGDLTAGLLPPHGSVGGDGGVEPSKVVEGRGAGVAELVDPERQRIVGPDAGGHHLRPVAVKVVVQPFEVFSPPALGRLEPLEGVLVAPELGYPACHLAEVVVGGGGAFGLADQLVLQAAALVATPGDPARRDGPGRQAVAGVCCDGVPVRQPRLGLVQFGNGDGQRLVGVGRLAIEHPLVFSHAVAELAVEQPRVAARRQRRIRSACQGVDDLLGGGPLVGEDAAVVHDGHRGGVPGVGGLTGT